MKKLWVFGVLGGFTFLAARSGHAVESAFDRPVAAVIDTEHDGLNLFACGADHVMRRRMRHPTQDAWSHWLQPPGALPCDSPPTGSSIRHSDSDHDEIDVYYRTTSNHLAEINIDTSGTVRVFDLSARSGWGAAADIAGTPAIAYMHRDQGASEAAVVATSVVTIQRSTNKIVTWDWLARASGDYPQGWSMHSVFMSSTAEALAYGSVFSTYYDEYGGFISARDSADRFTTFQTWAMASPFIFLNHLGTSAHASGVLTFGTSDPNSGFLCAMLFNSSTHKIDWWRLDDLSVKGTYSTDMAAGGSLFSNSNTAPNLDSNNYSASPGWSRSSNGDLLRYRMFGPQVKLVKTYVPVISGISPTICDMDYWCKNRPYALFASTANPGSAGNPSLWGSEGTAATTIDMNYPGGILAP